MLAIRLTHSLMAMVWVPAELRGVGGWANTLFPFIGDCNLPVEGSPSLQGTLKFPFHGIVMEWGREGEVVSANFADFGLPDNPPNVEHPLRKIWKRAEARLKVMTESSSTMSCVGALRFNPDLGIKEVPLFLSAFDSPNHTSGEAFVQMRSLLGADPQKYVFSSPPESRGDETNHHTSVPIVPGFDG